MPELRKQKEGWASSGWKIKLEKSLPWKEGPFSGGKISELWSVEQLEEEDQRES